MSTHLRNLKRLRDCCVDVIIKVIIARMEFSFRQESTLVNSAG